jgi:hypothetical protein
MQLLLALALPLLHSLRTLLLRSFDLQLPLLLCLLLQQCRPGAQLNLPQRLWRQQQRRRL